MLPNLEKPQVRDDNLIIKIMHGSATDTTMQQAAIVHPMSRRMRVTMAVVLLLYPIRVSHAYFMIFNGKLYLRSVFDNFRILQFHRRVFVSHAHIAG